MTRDRRTLRPWVEAEGGDALDERLAKLFRAVPPAGLGARELAEVRARLSAPVRARPVLFGRYAAQLGIGLLAGSGVAVASFGVQRWVAPPPATPAATPIAAPSASGPVRSGPVRPLRVAPPAPLPAPSAEQAPPEPARAFAPAAPASGPLARESELLARALTKLRSEADPAGALPLLDRYQREFPGGTLALESEVARLDAFLALGRHAEALVLLDRLPLDRIGRGAEPRVLRAELRARQDPGRALADYDLALAAPLAGALEERALFGRASCRLRVNDRAGATADLERYLERHPNGRFQAEARRELEKLR